MIRWCAVLWLIFLEIPWLRVIAIVWPVAGLCLVGYGAWRIYPPAGYLAVGVLMLLDSLHASITKGAARDH